MAFPDTLKNAKGKMDKKKKGKKGGKPAKGGKPMPFKKDAKGGKRKGC